MNSLKINDIINIMFEDISSSLSELLNSSEHSSIPFMPIIICGIVAALFILFFVIIYYMIRLFLRKRSFNKSLKNFEDSLSLKKCFNTLDESGQFFRNLALECFKIGKKIDLHTDRENNCESISSIMYEMCRFLNFDDNKTALYYCISMVYDVGFLEIPGYMFRAEILNDEERNMVKTHVMRGIYYYDFVNPDYIYLFKSAAVFHHENINGSGYPEGLMNEEIPEVARMIHIIETYISLINRRAYHKIRTSLEAVDELKKHNGIYDQRFVTVLESVL